MRQTIGNIIKKHRNKYHILQTSVAERLGISAQYLCDIESNRRVPSDRLIEKISHYIDVEQITNDEHDPIGSDYLYFLVNKFPPDIRDKNIKPSMVYNIFEIVRGLK